MSNIFTNFNIYKKIATIKDIRITDAKEKLLTNAIVYKGKDSMVPNGQYTVGIARAMNILKKTCLHNKKRTLVAFLILTHNFKINQYFILYKNPAVRKCAIWVFV